MLEYPRNWVAIAGAMVLLSAPPWAAAQTELPPPSSQTYPFESKNRFRPTMPIILVCLVSSFFVMFCISIFVRRCIDRYLIRSFTLEADGVGSGRRLRRRVVRGLDPTVIDSLPSFVYSDVKDFNISNGSSLECAVCLNEFEDFETLRFLPKCSHVFHSDCIDVWLSSHISCPVCRAELVPNPDETRTLTTPSHNPDWESTESRFSDRVHDTYPPNSNLNREASDLIVGIQFRDELFGTIQSENCERFRLRLPEEIRNGLVNSSLSRTKSCQVFPRARSSRKGYRSSSGGSGRRRNFHDYERFGREGWSWGFMTPPASFSRAGSVRLPKHSAPLDRLISGTDNNVGERSFDRLRFDG
ncbi:RING-type E3 ubiquitin transferase [Sarracenia purpurea var. burkii]